MVSQEAIRQNQTKLQNIKDMIDRLLYLHSSALHTYKVGGMVKTLPQPDIDAIVEDYQALKAEVSELFKELL